MMIAPVHGCDRRRSADAAHVVVMTGLRRADFPSVADDLRRYLQS